MSSEEHLERLVNIHINNIVQSISSMIDEKQLTPENTVDDLLRILRGEQYVPKYILEYGNPKDGFEERSCLKDTNHFHLPEVENAVNQLNEFCKTQSHGNYWKIKTVIVPLMS